MFVGVPDHMWSTAITVKPVNEPVTLPEAKAWLRVTDDDENTTIRSLIKMVREAGEKTTGRAFISQTIALYLDEFPAGGLPIRPPSPPFQSLTSIAYLDTDGNSQTWSSSLYETDFTQEPGRVQPIATETYPSTDDAAKAVTVTYVAGYGDDPVHVPFSIRRDILRGVAHLYDEGRSNVITGTIASELPMGRLFLLDRMLEV